MSPRTVMTASAWVLGALGLVLLFAPAEVGPLLGLGGAGAALATQLFGSALTSFALLDWAGRGAIYGGIYGRPIALGNFLLGFSVAAALAQRAASAPEWAMACVFGLHALAFGRILFFGGGPAADG